MSASVRRPLLRLNRQPIDNSWYLVVLLGLLFMFWVYARYIERVDVALVQNWLTARQLAVLAELPGLSFIVSFFHWKCCATLWR
jgi:hypothetical protein